MATPASTTLPVRYNPPVAWLMIVLGAINFGLGLLAGGALINVVLGVMFLVIGALCLARTYFTYTAATGTLVMTAPAGNRRTFQAGAAETFAVEGRRIFLVRADGGRKKLPVSRLMARPQEWDAVVEAIGRPAKAA